MSHFHGKKATILSAIEKALEGIDGAYDVIPGQYVTPAHLVCDLARDITTNINGNTIEKTFANAIDDLPETVRELAIIYGENSHLTGHDYRTVSLLGNQFRYLKEPNVTPILHYVMTYQAYTANLVGPGGEIPKGVPGEGYTLVGEHVLTDKTNEPDATSYYIHEIAKALTTVEGKGLEIQILESHSSIMLRSFGKAMFNHPIPFTLDRIDRRHLDLNIAATAAKHAALVQLQEDHADKRSAMRAVFEKALKDAASGVEPMVPLGFDITNDKNFPYQMAYEGQYKGKTKVYFERALGRPKDWYSLDTDAKRHRKSILESDTLEKQGGYKISRPLAAFLHSRYGTDIADLIKQVEDSNHQSCQIVDPRGQDKTKTFGLTITMGELCGRFNLGPNVQWKHSKITFEEGSLPAAIQASIKERNLNDIIDLSSIPGLEQVSITGYYPKKRGFTLTMDSTPVLIDEAMTDIEEHELKRAA